MSKRTKFYIRITALYSARGCMYANKAWTDAKGRQKPARWWGECKYEKHVFSTDTHKELKHIVSREEYLLCLVTNKSYKTATDAMRAIKRYAPKNPVFHTDAKAWKRAKTTALSPAPSQEEKVSEPDHPRCGDCGMYKGECECN